MIIPNKLYYELSKYCDNQLPLDSNRWRIMDRLSFADDPIMIRVLSLKNTNHRVFILTRKRNDIIIENGDNIDRAVFLARITSIARQIDGYISNQINEGYSYGITGESVLAPHVHVLAYTFNLYGASFGGLTGWEIIFSQSYDKLIKINYPKRVDKVGFPVSGFDVLSKDMKRSFGIAGHYYNFKIPITKILFGDKRIVILTMVNTVTFYVVALALKFLGLGELIYHQLCKNNIFMPRVVQNLCGLAHSDMVGQWVPIFLAFSFVWTLVASPLYVYYLIQNKTAVPYYQTRTQFNKITKMLILTAILLIFWLCVLGGSVSYDNVKKVRFILFYGSIISVPMVWAVLSYMVSGAFYLIVMNYKIIRQKRAL